MTGTGSGGSIDSMKFPRPVLSIVMGILCLLPLLAGTTGRINGILKDPGGTPVTGAKLTLVDNEKGTMVTVKSDRKGSYSFPNVFPGAYRLHVEAEGFVPQERSPVMVHVNSAMRIDLTLEAGAPAAPKNP